jgi:16S rRNA (cytosine967-C5)-methyltransferase
VLAKKPDAKWKREPEDLVNLVQTQRAILENAARHVKPDGILVYSTCTTEPEENFELIKNFLTDHSEFSIESASPLIDSRIVSADGYIETFPHRNAMDGSFAIRLKKAL